MELKPGVISSDWTEVVLSGWLGSTAEALGLSMHVHFLLGDVLGLIGLSSQRQTEVEATGMTCQWGTFC
jgi:hypothetical protein